jgi:hypothetical protein
VGGACGTNWREEEHVSVIGRKPEGKRPLGRPRHRWIDNIKMDLLRWDWEVCTGLVWLRIGTGEHDNEPSGSIKCGESTEWLHNLWPLEWYSAPQN